MTYNVSVCYSYCCCCKFFNLRPATARRQITACCTPNLNLSKELFVKNDYKVAELVQQGVRFCPCVISLTLAYHPLHQRSHITIYLSFMYHKISPSNLIYTSISPSNCRILTSIQTCHHLPSTFANHPLPKHINPYAHSSTKYQNASLSILAYH